MGDHAGFTPLELVEYLIENPEVLDSIRQQSRKKWLLCGTQQELKKFLSFRAKFIYEQLISF